MNSRRITLIVAVVLAVATGLLTLHYLTGVNQKEKAVVVQTSPVIVASVDIPMHARIKPQMLTKVLRPMNSIEPGVVVDASTAEGDVALAAINAGTAIMQTQIGQPASVGVAGALHDGERAITIPVDSVKSVAGLVQPGDHVDIVASIGTGGGGRSPESATIIRDATVLAVNDETSTVAASPPPIGTIAPTKLPPSTVTLAVSARQADLLTVADLNATLRLALRPPDEPKNSTPAETLDLAAAPPAAPAPPAAAPAAAPAPAAAAPAKPKPGIPVIDGDHIVQE